MQPHTRIYLDEFDYAEQDFIPCEVCGKRAVDIHHIEARGMGGTSKIDVIENLMALCRSCHVTYGDIKKHLEMLTRNHKEFTIARKIEMARWQ